MTTQPPTTKTELSASEALQQLREGKSLSNVVVRDRLDVAGELPNGVKFEQSELHRVQFHGPIANGVQFGACKVRTLRFDEAIVEGDVDLRGSELVHASFVKTEVKGSTRLDLVSTVRALRFCDCELHGQVRLWDGRFHDWVEFSRCKFHGRADFRSFHADEGFVAKDCRFADEMLFRGSTVCKKLEFTGSRFDAVTDFSKAKLRDVTYLEAIEQGPGHQFAFHNALFDRVLVRSDQLRGRLASEERGDHLTAAEEYGLLKKNFQNLNRYDEEDLAFYQFKVNKRRSRETSWLRPWSKLTGLFEFLFLDLGCGYGAKPFRAVGSAILLMTLFAAVYAAGIERFDVAEPPISTLPLEQTANRSLFGLVTSVSVFTSGFSGEHLQNAHGWVLIPLAVEALMGTLLWGLFIVAFSRKVIR